MRTYHCGRITDLQSCELQAATGQDGKPMLGRFSSKVGGLLDELADVLGAFEGIPTQEGQPCLSSVMR